MTVQVFDTAGDPAASDRFIKWRKAHLVDGFYLNASPQYGWVLHKASCGHAMIAGEADLARFAPREPTTFASGWLNATKGNLIAVSRASRRFRRPPHHKRDLAGYLTYVAPAGRCMRQVSHLAPSSELQQYSAFEFDRRR